MARHVCYCALRYRSYNDWVRKCATCYRKYGTSESNWICERCRKKPQNWGWVGTPREEMYGVEVTEDQNDSSPLPDSDPGKFETPLCIEIMRRFVMRHSRRRIAKELKTGEGYVRRTISFWKDNYPHFLEQLMKAIGELN